MKHTNPLKDLRHLKNHEINFIKWDNCINNAHNGSLYAFSWYLNILSSNWEGIVQKDYQAVMPLLVRNRAGIKYVYTSILANQLGVFSTEITDEKLTNIFIEKVHHKFKIFHITLNKFNTINPSLFRQKINNTYEFDLISNYDIIRASYSDAVSHGIDLAGKNKVHINRGLTPKEFMEFVRDQSVIASGKPKKETISSLRKIVDFVITHGLGEIYAAYSPENNLCASVLFLKSQRNACVLYSGISEDGIKLKAMELLIDLFIRNNAEKNITLSFENLAIPNKEKLFNGFGAGNYHYTTVKNPLNPFRIII
jgi:hypothetical protein